MGLTLYDECLKGSGRNSYLKKLLDRIRYIHSPEKMLYRHVRDLYATSVDYYPLSRESIFQIVQNYSLSSPVGTLLLRCFSICWREQPFIWLCTFSGLPVLRNMGITKNYLDELELSVLNNVVSSCLDMAEIATTEHMLMYMRD